MRLEASSGRPDGAPRRGVRRAQVELLDERDQQRERADNSRRAETRAYRHDARGKSDLTLQTSRTFSRIEEEGGAAPPDGSSTRRDRPVAMRGASRPSFRRDGLLMLTPAELVWLMAAVAKGDQAAFERLYAATRAKLYGVVLRILISPMVLQETYLKIWNSAGTFDPSRTRRSPGWWRSRNRALDPDPQEDRGLDRDEPAAEQPARRPSAGAARDDRGDAVAPDASGQLQEDRRRMVLLAYYSGWSREAVSAKFDAAADQSVRNSAGRSAAASSYLVCGLDRQVHRVSAQLIAAYSLSRRRRMPGAGSCAGKQLNIWSI